MWEDGTQPRQSPSMLLNAVLLLAVVSEAAALCWGQARLITDHLDMLTKIYPYSPDRHVSKEEKIGEESQKGKGVSWVKAECRVPHQLSAYSGHTRGSLVAITDCRLLQKTFLF